MVKVFEALDAEWKRLGRDRWAAQALPEVCRHAGGAASLADVHEFVRAASPADADRVLLALVTVVVSATAPHPRPERDVARLAARVLLQLLLPGTRRLARKWWALGEPDEQDAAAVAAVYHRIRNYPLERRPGRVAANILMDASYDIRRTLPRLISAPVEDVASLPRRAQPEPAQNPSEELAEVLVDAVEDGAIKQSDAEIIARSRIADVTVEELAAERQRTPRTVWHHRHNAEAALSRALRGAKKDPPSPPPADPDP